ncbi:MAG TPA: hypothetical protein PKA00_08890 [Saprospiraceae bacterium]|nr:hypothetical protein [Saprospiraceae bacterium]HMQ83011.1 hypothetical protein [Saprospiraceae bacterium]
MAREIIIKQNIGFILRSTFLLFKHKNDKSFLEEFSEEIFTFVESRELNEDQKLFFLKQLFFYLFSTLSFQPEEFLEFTKKLPAMTKTIANSLYDNLLQEGLEKGLEKGIEKGVKKGEILEIQHQVMLLHRMLERGIEMSLMHQLSALPELFIQQFCQYFSIENIQPLIENIHQASEAPTIEAMQNDLKEALLQYGFTTTAIEALLAATSSSHTF